MKVVHLGITIDPNNIMNPSKIVASI